MKKIAIAFAVLTFSLIVYPLPQARATTPGIYFDHIVIIAFENQNLNAIFGSPNAPFINSMLSGGSYTTAYSVDQTGCSAACYLQMTSGSNQGKSDGYCPRANSPCLTVSNLFSLFDSFNGLTYQAYCEFDSTQSPTTCPRGADHFPFIAYSNANPGSNGGCFLAGNCANIFGGTASSCSGHSCTSADFVSAANAVTPPNFLWYTPSDCNNMHGQTSNCANGCASSDSTCFVQQGDSYLQNFLIGTGTLSNPATGSLFASNAFSTGMRTLFVLWFDENSNPPELFYGTQVHQGFVSSMTYTHYGVLRTIEQNWGLGYLANSASSINISELFSGSPTVLLTPNPWSCTIIHNCSLPFTVESQFGFSGTVTFTFQNLPTGDSVTFTPTSVTIGIGAKASTSMVVSGPCSGRVPPYPTVVATPNAGSQQSSQGRFICVQ